LKKRIILGIFVALLSVVFLIGATTGDSNRHSNSWQPVQLVDSDGVMYGNKSIDNKMRIIANSYYYEVAKGNITNHTPIHLFGVQSATVLNTHTDLNELGVNTTPLPTSAIAMEVVSTSAQDGVAGTGALTVSIYGLDANYAEINETVTMNGTTAVATANSYLRINNFYINTAGTSLAAVGTISFQASGGGTEYSRISIGHTASQQALYTVPASKQAVILGGSAGGVVAKDVSIFFQANSDPVDGDKHDGIFFIYDRFVLKDDSMARHYQLPKIVPEKSDIKITCESLDNDGGYVTGTIDLYIEPN